MKKIAVIGGGASGMVAACFASGTGKKVLLFEKQKKLGRKLLATGNGRCNISNRNLSVERYHGKNPRFIHNVFSRFGLDETIEFFQSIGIPFVEENNGKLFPASLQSQTVVSLLEYELQKRGVDVRLHRRIDRITPGKDRFKIITAGKEEDIVDAVILSSGSCAYSELGASKIGYELAEQLKHTVIEPFPSILPINIPFKPLHKLQGIKWDCTVRVTGDGRDITSSEGELLFTGHGISGPVSLDVSRAVNERMIKGDKTEIIIDLFPEHTAESLGQLMGSIWRDPAKTIAFSLMGILKQKMPEFILGIAGIDHDARVGSLSKGEIRSLIETMKSVRLKPGKPRGFNEAVVAAGGVDVGEIDPATMESLLRKNLHITGELLDIDGDSGGYNLQFAWSTGALAGIAQDR